MLWRIWLTLARRYAVMRPFLSEFQRRLWLGAEAAELGPGGVAVVAKATGVAADTVRRGRAEADAGTGPGEGRSRRSGGGRKRAEEHDPELVRQGRDPQLEKAVEVVLEELKKNPLPMPKIAPFPDYYKDHRRQH